MEKIANGKGMEEEFFIMRAAVVPRIGGKWEVKEAARGKGCRRVPPGSS
jgi:hypothetical protein